MSDAQSAQTEAAESLVSYLSGLPDQDEKIVSYGLDTYSPRELADEVRRGTDVGRRFVDMWERD